MTDLEPRQDDAAALEAACRSVTRLLSSAAGPLRRMQVRVGDVAVELDWPEAAGVPGPPPAAPVAESTTGHMHVTAPGVGTFYHAPEPGAEPFVRAGDTVKPGQQIGILEVMKLMIPVEADCAGRVVEVLAGDGSPVEFGQALISVAPE